MAIDLKKLNDKFFTDPDWKEVEEMILEYINPFKSVLNIRSGASNAEIAAEVRGRQLMVENLEKFLEDTKFLRSKLSKDKLSYK